MQDIHWVIPSKKKGSVLQPTTEKYNPVHKQAVEEIAAEESMKLGGKKIGRLTLLMTIATQKGPEITELKTRLNSRIAQLNKEKQRHAHQKSTSTVPGISVH